MSKYKVAINWTPEDVMEMAEYHFNKPLSTLHAENLLAKVAEQMKEEARKSGNAVIYHFLIKELDL